jgi:hypothetical protein
MYCAHIAAFVVSVAVGACANYPRTEHSTAGIPVEPELLAAAREAHFDYMKQLARAERGDGDALLALIEVSPKIAHSAAGSEQHGDVLLAFRKRVGRTTFTDAMGRASPDARGAATITLRVAEENDRLLHTR